jgi:hypothetical protein
VKLKKATHRFDREFILVFLDKALLYSGLLAKYLAAFFNMSLSSMTRFNSASSWAIFSCSSGDLTDLGLSDNWLCQ